MNVVLGEIDKVRDLDRNILISGPKKIRENKLEFKLVMDYNLQYRKLEKIISKNWGILL